MIDPTLPVLVTGAAGFIGSHLCERLLADGHRVIGLDNFDSFYDPALKRDNATALTRHNGFSLIEGDIRSEDDVCRAFSQGPFSVIVHLAARAGVRPSIREPLLYDEVNVRGTTTLLEQARRTPSTHFVHGSSSSVYGSGTPVPFSEEHAADRPSSPYAATKRANELTAHAFHHLYGLPVTCLRFFTVYGPRQRPEMAIHRFTRLIAAGRPVEMYGDGTSRRDYTFIDDIVDGVVRTMHRPNGYRVLNLGTTATTSLGELLEMIAQRLGEPLSIRQLPDQPGDVPITFADISRAREALGYEPSTPLATGLDRFIEWYLHARRPEPSGASPRS